MTAPFGDRVTVMLTRAPVLFQGKGPMTVQEHIKFIRLLREFRRVLGQRLLRGALAMDLCVGVFVGLKSSTSSAYYHQVLGGTGLASGELVVPWCIWVLLMKLPEFLQTAY